jgi:hypothetical protein
MTARNSGDGRRSFTMRDRRDASVEARGRVRDDATGEVVPSGPPSGGCECKRPAGENLWGYLFLSVPLELIFALLVAMVFNRGLQALSLYGAISGLGASGVAFGELPAPIAGLVHPHVINQEMIEAQSQFLPQFGESSDLRVSHR